MSVLSDTFAEQLQHCGSSFDQEYRFAAIATGGTGTGTRARLREAHLKDWRFDFAWPDLLIACEVEGGTFSGGRHTRGQGFEGDCEKYNAATLLGWKVFRVTSKMIHDGRAFALMQDALLPF
jgi:hypothetical protein